MNLHARNVAIQAGIPSSYVNHAVAFMKSRNRINIKTAKQYLKSHESFITSQTEIKQSVQMELSSLFVELEMDFLTEPLILTILLDSKTPTPHHITIEKSK